MEFSIEEIRALLQMDPEALSNELQKKADSFETAIIENQLKQGLCIDFEEKTKFLLALLLAIAIIIGGIGIGFLQEKLLASTDYLFFEPVQVTEILVDR